LVDLTHCLRDLGKHITIETAGALFVPDLACDLMSISPKLADSASHQAGNTGTHQSNRIDPEALSRLIRAYPYQLKFVVDGPADVPEVWAMLEQLGDLAPERVMLMPQAATAEELLAKSPAIAEACQEAGLRFGPRLHVLLWDGRRGV
jgi:7-carboxy-7-deazaguanine synthase